MDPSVVGDLTIARVDTASSIGHSIWLSFKRNCYLIQSENNRKRQFRKVTLGRLKWKFQSK